jgi:hypothetical protein
MSQELIEGSVDEGIIAHATRGSDHNLAPPLTVMLSSLERALSPSFRSSWALVLRVCSLFFRVSTFHLFFCELTS